MRHACVPPRCGRMRVPEGLERGAGITRIAVTPMGHPRKLPEPLCGNASLGCKQIDQPCRRNATTPWRPSAMHRTHHASRNGSESSDAAQAPELRPGLHPLVLTRSVIVGLPPAAPGSSQAAVAGQSGPGRVGVGPRGHSGWQSESLAVATGGDWHWPLPVRLERTGSTPPASAFTPPNAGQCGGGAATQEPGEL